MTGGDVMRGVWALFAGLFKGLFAVTLTIALLVICSKLAFGDEDIHLHTDVVGGTEADELYWFAVFDTALDEAFSEALDTVDCEKSNRTLRYMLDRIAANTKKNPELAYIYKPTIEIIHASWCTE